MAFVIRPRIGLVELSVTIKEVYAHVAQASDHPIETGSSMSDHIHSRPFMLTMDAIIAGAHSGLDDAGHIAVDDDAPPNPVASYLHLLDIWEKKEAIEVFTGLRTYRNMVVENFTVTRDQKTSAVLAFTATLKQIRFANALTVEVKEDVETKTGKTKALGEKPTKPAPEAAAEGARGSLSQKLLSPFIQGIQ